MRESVKVTLGVLSFVAVLIAMAFYFSSITEQFVFITLMNGVQSAALFILLALGLSLIFGIMGVVNFAHGSLFMVGAYAAWFVSSSEGLDLPYVVGVLAAVLAAAAIGLLIETQGLRRLYDENILLQVLFTFSIALILEGLAILVFGPIGKTLSAPEWGSGALSLNGFVYPTFRLIIIVVSVVSIAAVYLLLQQTNIGLIIRAGTQDSEMVRSLAIDVQWVFSLVFAIGAGLAGFAGALAAPIRTLKPGMGTDIIIETFVVVVIGGLGSFLGTILGGVAVAEISTFSGYIPILQEYSAAAIFIFMAIVLLIRPRGLLGEIGLHEE